AMPENRVTVRFSTLDGRLRRAPSQLAAVAGAMASGREADFSSHRSIRSSLEPRPREGPGSEALQEGQGSGEGGIEGLCARCSFAASEAGRSVRAHSLQRYRFA